MRKRATSQPSFRQHKQSDIVAFNAGAESHFVKWLKDEIAAADEPPSFGWVLSNAAFELDVSVETVKRYIIKHTADRAEFMTDGKCIVIRE